MNIKRQTTLHNLEIICICSIVINMHVILAKITDIWSNMKRIVYDNAIVLSLQKGYS